jgi:hypothetical protein
MIQKKQIEPLENCIRENSREAQEKAWIRSPFVAIGFSSCNCLYTKGRRGQNGSKAKTRHYGFSHPTKLECSWPSELFFTNRNRLQGRQRTRTPRATCMLQRAQLGSSM